MGIAAGLEQRQRDRQEWLANAIALFEADDSVVGAWLWGSEGRGEADALSDFDLFVALADEQHLESIEDRFGAFGYVRWCREVPFNAPVGGRYFSVGFPATVQDLPVDFYWQPAAMAVVGVDARVIVEKRPLPRADVETFATFVPMDERPSPHPEDPTLRLSGLLAWFWFMFTPTAKKIARRQMEESRQQVALLDGVLALAMEHVQRPHRPVAGNPLEALSSLAEEMESIHADLRGVGVDTPDTADARRAVDFASEAVRAGWRP
jgi:hypothetical protein